MNDHLSISSQNAPSPHIDYEGHSQDPSLEGNTPEALSGNLITQDKIPDSLKKDYKSSHAQLAEPTCSLTPSLIASLSSLANQGLIPMNPMR